MLTAPVTDRLLYAHCFAAVAAVHDASHGISHRDNQHTSPSGFPPIGTHSSTLFFYLLSGL